MIRNNIVLSVYVNGEDVVLEYDDNTAIGLNYNAYQIENLGALLLDYTRGFSLPKTPTNNQAFYFVCSENSTTKFPYRNIPMKISVNGVKVMEGDMYVSSVEDRYEVQLVVHRDIFNTLKKLPFVAIHSNTYPISVASKLCSYWNNTVRESIRQTSAPTHYDEWMNAVIEYCEARTETAHQGYYEPKGEFIIPVVLNQFADTIAKFDENGTFTTSKNNIYETAGNEKGFYIAQSFPYVEGVTVKRYGNTLVSPLWCRMDVVLQNISTYLQQETGYTLGNLYEKIYSIVGRHLYCHIPSLEFEYDYLRNGVVQFLGYTKIIKGGDGIYGYKFDGSLSDLSDDDFPTFNCCDIIKSLIQDFALVFDIDVKNKCFVFNKLNDIMSSDVYELKMYGKQSTKRFSLDNYKQKQSIQYDNDDSNKFYGSLNVNCNNENIEEGSYEDSLMTIDRYLFSSREYSYRHNNRSTGISNLPNLIDNETEKKLIYSTAGCTGYGTSTRFLISICEENDNDTKHMESRLWNTVNPSSCVVELKQPAVSTSNVYRILQEIAKTPIKYDIDVDMSTGYELIYNFKHFAICRIEGLPGYYYIQSINDYNPRTDNTLSLTIVKLPPVAVDLFKLIVTENDIDFITEEDANLITEESNH